MYDESVMNVIYEAIGILESSGNIQNTVKKVVSDTLKKFNNEYKNIAKEYDKQIGLNSEEKGKSLTNFKLEHETENGESCYTFNFTWMSQDLYYTYYEDEDAISDKYEGKHVFEIFDKIGEQLRKNKQITLLDGYKNIKIGDDIPIIYVIFEN